MDDVDFKIIKDQQSAFSEILEKELNEPVGGAGTDDGWCQLTPEQMENDLIETPTKVIKTLMQGGLNTDEND